MRNILYLFILLSFTFISKGQTLSTDTFCLANRYSIGTVVDSVQFSKPILMDMNDDGQKDLIIYDFDNGKIKYYKNNGSTFVFDSEISDNNVKSIAVGYLNLDNYPEIIALEQGNTGKVKIYENQIGISGTFSLVTTVSAPVISTGTLVPKYVYAEDMTGDYFSDIVVTCIKKEFVSDFYGYYIHQNDPYFSTSITINAAPTINIVNGFAAVADPIITFGNFGFNDGYKDIAYSSASVGGSISIQQTLGTSLFYTVTSQTIINVANGSSCQTLKEEDFNGDGIKDIGYMNNGVLGGLKQIILDANLNYTVTPIVSQPNGYDYSLVDLNNDGNKEYIGFNTSNGRFFLNKNMGSNYPLTLTSNQYTLNTSNNFNEAHFMVEDIDANGYPDIIATGSFGLTNHGAIRIIKNYSYSVNIASNNNAISCSGSSVTISASTNNIITNGNYSWSSGAVGQTISTNITGGISAHYNFTVTNNSGVCSLISNHININSVAGTLPILTLAASTNTYCWSSSNSNSFTLTATSSATNITWDGGGQTAIGNEMIIYANQGTQLYTCTAESGGCYATQTISPIGYQTPYMPYPDGSWYICSGETATLSIQLSGNTVLPSYYESLVWYNGTTAQSQTTTVNNYTSTPTSTTAYSVTAFNHGCASDTVTYYVNVNPLPVINVSSNYTVCQGSTNTVSLNPNSSYQYTTAASTNSVYNTSTYTDILNTTTTYTVHVEDTGGNGCSKDSTFTVYVDIPPTSLTTNTNYICSGQAATLTTTGATNYTYVTSAGFTYTNNSDTVSNVLSNLTYTIYSQNGVCAPSTITNTIFVSPSPTITILSLSSVSVCSGNSITLTPQGANTYTLLPNNIVNNSFILTPSVTTTYTINGTSTNGCENISAYNVIKTITVSPTPTLSITGGTTICSGNTTTLIATGANTYTWINSGGNTESLNTIANITPSVIGANTYYLTGSNGTCSKSLPINITVNTTPQVSISASSTSLCPVIDTCTLTANSSNGNWNYTWQPSVLGTNSVTPSFTIGTNDVTATVTAKDIATGCNNTATITIYSKPVPLVTASPSSTTVCNNTSVSLIASGTAVSYTWWPSLNVNSNYIFTATNPETYTVIGTGANGCKNFAVSSVNIFNYQNVNAFATPSVICLGNTATLSVTGGSATVANYNGQEIKPTKNEIYPITIQDINGCFYNDTAYVFINTDCVPKPFTGFSPNNDGTNDIFYIDGIAGVTNRVSIYDRWGIELYSQDNYNNTTIFWDGSYKGKVVPTGTYFYVIELKDTKEIKKGWLEITTN